MNSGIKHTSRISFTGVFCLGERVGLQKYEPNSTELTRTDSVLLAHPKAYPGTTGLGCQTMMEIVSCSLCVGFILPKCTYALNVSSKFSWFW